MLWPKAKASFAAVFKSAFDDQWWWSHRGNFSQAFEVRVASSTSIREIYTNLSLICSGSFFWLLDNYQSLQLVLDSKAKKPLGQTSRLYNFTMDWNHFWKSVLIFVHLRFHDIFLQVSNCYSTAWKFSKNSSMINIIFYGSREITMFFS